MYYNRQTREIENPDEGGQKALEVLYNTKGGRLVLWSVAARPWFSELIAKYHRSTLSHKDIAPFIKKNKMKICPKKASEEYSTFNDFFTRKKNVRWDSDESVLISPATSKVQAFPITDNLRLRIKGTTYSIGDILGSDVDAQSFKNGTCLVFRLSVDDYHRYHYIDDGRYLGVYKIPGELHTVRPISEKYGVFARNTRVVNMFETKHFGRVAQIEIGALLVGKIINHSITPFFKRGQEKGYFEFGGSTIVMLLNKEIEFDEDIQWFSDLGVEVKVTAGERIGRIKEATDEQDK